LAFIGYLSSPYIQTALNTVSTDDAYVNGHVTLVAPRVAGQVQKVLVDDNMRVKKGDIIVQLDKEPFEIEVAIKKAAVVAAESDLAAAEASVRSSEALARSQRWQLQSAIEQVDNQVAHLRADVATYESKVATWNLSKANLERGEKLLTTKSMTKEEYEQRAQLAKVDEMAVKQALETVYATRVGLGLPTRPEDGRALTDVPENLQQTFSQVRTALSRLVQTMAGIGVPLTKSEATPTEVLDEFRRRDANRDIDQVLADLVPNAPGVKQAESRLLQARRDLAQAELDLRYTDIVSEIDGVVTRRNVNPGNHVQVGENLMAVRSLTEIWIDANFKETQLGELRIGQRVRLEVDMYGTRQKFEGRISGFTMGTGQTLSLLPPQNATGNFVKIVQRLPVRIELTNYEPDKSPLFVGLSVTPYVYFKESAEGPNAGKILQPFFTAMPSSNEK
jgi:membrane fusion protein (multidrug efflux system)